MASRSSDGRLGVRKRPHDLPRPLSFFEHGEGGERRLALVPGGDDEGWSFPGAFDWTRRNFDRGIPARGDRHAGRAEMENRGALGITEIGVGKDTAIVELDRERVGVRSDCSVSSN
jgi:hypothetical protein